MSWELAGGYYLKFKS